LQKTSSEDPGRTCSVSYTKKNDEVLSRNIFSRKQDQIWDGIVDKTFQSLSMFFLLVKLKEKCPAVFSCKAGGRTIILHFLLCIISPSVAGIILLVHQCKS
jgi:hypothetical protein